MGISDLKDFTQRSKEEHRSICAKGGRTVTIARKMGTRDYCNSTCPMWNGCWARSASIAQYDKDYDAALKKGATEKELKKLKPKCALKNLPEQAQQRTWRLVTEGEAGFKLEIIDQLQRLGNELSINPTPRTRERYLYQLRECMKAIYGDRKRIDANVKADVSAESLNEAYASYYGDVVETEVIEKGIEE